MVHCFDEFRADILTGYPRNDQLYLGLLHFSRYLSMRLVSWYPGLGLIFKSKRGTGHGALYLQ